MCGLVGMAGDLSHQARTSIFKDFLDVCQVRGRDSTGVVKVDKDLEYTWAKQVGPPNALYDCRVYDNRIDKTDACVLIGHTRSKTSGEVNIKCAHPFDIDEDEICGVHNGTLRMTHNLDTYHHSKVDSEILYGHLAKNGVKDTFEQVEGAYACVWWNGKEKTLNFIRNDERPLYFTWSKDLKMMFWASETWMFGAVGRKIPLWDGGEAKQVYYELPIHTLWSFRINTKATGEEKILSLRPVMKVEPSKKAFGVTPTTTNFRGNDAGWRNTGRGTYERDYRPNGQNGGGSVANPFSVVRAPEEVLLLDDPLPDALGPDGKPTSPLSNVAFLKSSAQSTASKMDWRNTRRSRNNTLSLPAPTSTSSLPNSSDEQSGKPGSSSKRSRKLVQRLNNGVSFRTVAGLEYITDNVTSQEYSLLDFYHNTDGVCTFCKHSILDIREVGAFIDKSNVLCIDCMSEPTAEIIQEPRPAVDVC